MQCRTKKSVGLALDLEDYHPSVLLHCWFGHLTCKIVSEMTYNVSSGTLNPTIPQQKICQGPITGWRKENRKYEKQRHLPGRNFPLNSRMMSSHFSFDSIRAKPTPRLTPWLSRRIRVEITWPNGAIISLRSVSDR